MLHTWSNHPCDPLSHYNAMIPSMLVDLMVRRTDRCFLYCVQNRLCREFRHQENPQHLCLTHEDLCAACGEKSHEPKYLKIPRLPKPHETHKFYNHSDPA